MSKNAVKVTVTGVRETVEKLRSYPRSVQQKGKELIQETALIVAAGAKKRCPVNKQKGIGGSLRASIRPTYYNNGLTADIGTDIEYGPFVEFGTGVRGQLTSSLFIARGELALPEGYKHGPSPGAPAQPFLHPSLVEAQPDYIRKMRKIVEP